MDRLYPLEQLLEGGHLVSIQQYGRPELDILEQDRLFGEQHQQTLGSGYSIPEVPNPDYNSILQEQGLIPYTCIQDDELPVNLSGSFSHQYATIQQWRNPQVVANQPAGSPPSIPQLTTASNLTPPNESDHPPTTTSGNYHGASQARTSFVTRGEKCCLFLKRLPANITVRKFVHQLQTHRIGKLAAIYINPPDAGHRTAAMKVTMWSREGAEKLYDAITTDQISFDRHTLQVYWNRHRVGRQTAQNASRVLLVIGRPEHVRPGVMLP